MRYLCIFWKNWSPEKTSVLLKDTRPSGQNWDPCLSVFWTGLTASCLQWANKQGEGRSMEGISCVNDHPGLFCCRKPQRERQGPVGNCSSQLISDLLGSPYSESQSKLPNFSPSFICTSEWKHHPSSILPSFPLSPISHIHHVPKFYLVSWISPKYSCFFPSLSTELWSSLPCTIGLPPWPSHIICSQHQQPKESFINVHFFLITAWFKILSWLSITLK